MVKPLHHYRVQQGKGEGRVWIKLIADDDTAFQVWLTQEQAERLAADILGCRFNLPLVVVRAPKRLRNGAVYVSFRSEPRPPGARPDFSEKTLKYLERTDPTIRDRLKAAQEKWDRKAARQRGKQGNARRPYGFMRNK
jgi:hypothetical protein